MKVARLPVAERSPAITADGDRETNAGEKPRPRGLVFGWAVADPPRRLALLGAGVATHAAQIAERERRAGQRSGVGAGTQAVERELQVAVGEGVTESARQRAGQRSAEPDE